MWLIVGQMPIQAGWSDNSVYSGISAEAISTASTFLQQKQSISLSWFLQCQHFRNCHSEFFCIKGVLKNFAKFTRVSSDTGVSCEFCEILRKNTFFHRTPPVAASGICTNWDFTSLFLRTISFFIKMRKWHRIFSFSFTGSTFNNHLIIVHLKQSYI